MRRILENEIVKGSFQSVLLVHWAEEGGGEEIGEVFWCVVESFSLFDILYIICILSRTLLYIEWTTYEQMGPDVLIFKSPDRKAVANV